MKIPVTTTGFSTLVRNLGLLGKEFGTGCIANLDGFKNNAFILSALIQVISRIFVANRTAQQTKNTADGPFRYMEAVKTTFREAMGFCLSYIVLRAFQRGSIDFLRNFLWIRKGISTKPTVLNGLFRRLLVPKNIELAQGATIGERLKDAAKGLKSCFQIWRQPAGTGLNLPHDRYPGLFETIKAGFSQIRDYSRGKLQALDLAPLQIKRFRHMATEAAQTTKVFVHNEGLERPQLKMMMPWLDRVAKYLDRSDPSKLDLSQKLKIFFDWTPLIVGSIPALLLSGLMLERFSQNHAENLAQKIARFLHRQSGEDASGVPNNVVIGPPPVVNYPQGPTTPAWSPAASPVLMQGRAPYYGPTLFR